MYCDLLYLTEKNFIVRTKVGPCARGLCAKGVRWGCVRGFVPKVVRSGCVPIVRSPGQKYCALRTAQPFWIVQDSLFSMAQPFQPLCVIYFVGFFLSITVGILVMVKRSASSSQPANASMDRIEAETTNPVIVHSIQI